MNFSSLINKEIERKRKKAAPNNAKKQKVELKAEEKPSLDPNVSPQAFLDLIPSEKLNSSLNNLDGITEKELSKEDQLQKLDRLVKAEKKKKEYEQYLQLENDVDPTINLEDIGHIQEKKKSLELQIRKFFKYMISVWEQNPESPPQQYTLALLEQVKKDMIKLLYKLRAGKLSDSIIISLSTIVYYIQHQDFVKANESYMKLSIGNTAWPIGIRDVGIHARSALSKITGEDKSTVANIMQSESMKRWIIAVKRIISYTEKTSK